MFNKSKLQIKGDRKPTELEEQAAKTLSAFETAKTSTGELAQNLKYVFVCGAEEVEYTQADGTVGKYVLLKIPFRSLGFFKRIGDKIIEHLEEKFKWPVIVIAQRTIQSKRAHTHASQQRPRSRTLRAVHKEFLNDVVVPSSIVGRSVRCAASGETSERVFLDPLDRALVQDKLEAMAHAYQKLTTHKISLQFGKPTRFQQKTLEKLQQKQQK